MAEVIDDNSPFEKPTDNEKELVEFVVDHTDRWREYRNQNFLDDWEKYERIFRGEWAVTEKNRDSERSKIISPATQQAVETSHAETMEAIFGQGEFFDIKDDLRDQNGPMDVEILKKQLYEDFFLLNGVSSVPTLIEEGQLFTAMFILDRKVFLGKCL